MQGPKACLKLISRPGWSDKEGDRAKVVERREMAKYRRSSMADYRRPVVAQGFRQSGFIHQRKTGGVEKK